LRAGGRQALTSPMQQEGEERRDVSFGFSRSPKDDSDAMIEEDAKKNQTVRFAAILKNGSHGYKRFLILYPDSPGHGYSTAHRLLGTQVAHEAKMGPRGLKTI
jgi:hypothetical protein